MVCFSICLYHLWFLSSVWYSFLWDSFLNFSCWSLLLVYRNAGNFYIFILYPVTLLNSLISSSSFMVDFLVFSMGSIMSSANMTILLLLQCGFLLFLFSDTVARTSKTILNNSFENGHPCLVLDLRGNAFCFWETFMRIFAMGLSYVDFITLRQVSSLPSFQLLFIINQCWILSKAFLNLLRWSYGILFLSLSI